MYTYKVAFAAALFALTLLPNSALHAQSNGRIAGIVMESGSDEPLPGVNVQVKDTGAGAVSDMDGRFEIGGLSEGVYVLGVSSVGFVSEQFRVRVANNTVRTVRIPLQPAVVEIPELLVERESMLAHPTGLDGIPGSVHRVPIRALQKFAATDVNRALRNVPGLNLQEEDGYGLRPNIGIRGSGAARSQKISLMEDGVLVAPAPYAAPAAYYFPTIGRMQEIEVRKGSSQIKYGPYTTGGAVNLVSRSIPESFTGETSVLAGMEQSVMLEGMLGNSWRHGGFIAQAFNARTNGFKELDNGDNTGFNKTDVMVKGRINTNKDARVYQALSLKLLLTDELSNETYLGLTREDFRTNPLRRYAGSAEDEMDAGYQQAMLRHLVVPAQDLRIITTAYRSTFSRNWYKLDKVGGISIAGLLSNPEEHSQEYSVVSGRLTNSDIMLAVKANNREYLSRGLQSTVAYGHSTTFGRVDLEMGVRIHEDEMDRFQWVDDYAMTESGMARVRAGTPGTESNRIEKAKAVAVFLQPRLMAGRFTIQPGLRYEDISIGREDFGKSDPGRTGVDLSTRENEVQVWIPGVGVSAELSAVVKAFAGVHRGFAPPGSREGTDPEASINYELGLRYRNGVSNATVALFYHDYSNLLGSDLAATGGTGSGDLFNGGAATVRGLEVTLRDNLGRLLNWRMALPVGLSYTFTDATFGTSFSSDFSNWGEVSEGDELPYVPRNQVSVDIGLEADKLAFNVQGAWIDDLRTIAGQGALVPSESIASFFVVEASAGYALTPGMRLFGVARNLFNNHYAVARHPAGLRPGLPRTVHAGLRIVF